jgi:hypothetical protein
MTRIPEDHDKIQRIQDPEAQAKILRVAPHF